MLLFTNMRGCKKKTPPLSHSRTNILSYKKLQFWYETFIFHLNIAKCIVSAKLLVLRGSKPFQKFKPIFSGWHHSTRHTRSLWRTFVFYTLLLVRKELPQIMLEITPFLTIIRDILLVYYSTIQVSTANFTTTFDHCETNFEDPTILLFVLTLARILSNFSFEIFVIQLVNHPYKWLYPTYCLIYLYSKHSMCISYCF